MIVYQDTMYPMQSKQGKPIYLWGFPFAFPISSATISHTMIIFSPLARNGGSIRDANVATKMESVAARDESVSCLIFRFMADNLGSQVCYHERPQINQSLLWDFRCQLTRNRQWVLNVGAPHSYWTMDMDIVWPLDFIMLVDTGIIYREAV